MPNTPENIPYYASIAAAAAMAQTPTPTPGAGVSSLQNSISNPQAGLSAAQIQAMKTANINAGGSPNYVPVAPGGPNTTLVNGVPVPTVGYVGTPFDIPYGAATFVVPGTDIIDYTTTARNAILLGGTGGRVNPNGTMSYSTSFDTSPIMRSAGFTPNPNALPGSENYLLNRAYFLQNPTDRFLTTVQQYNLQQENVLGGTGVIGQTNWKPTVENPILKSDLDIASFFAGTGSILNPYVALIALSEGFKGAINLPLVSGLVDWGRSVITPSQKSTNAPLTIIGTSPIAGGTITPYVPFGNYAQTELLNTKDIYEAGGEIDIYQQMDGSNVFGLVSSGSRNALQSGMFTITEPETPLVYTQAGAFSGTLSPSANISGARSVLANPARYATLGSEVYGGYVTPLTGATVQSTGAQLSTYANQYNLAGLVNPQAVNIPKAQLPDISAPWLISGSSPALQLLGPGGLTPEPLPGNATVNALASGTYMALPAGINPYSPLIGGTTRMSTGGQPSIISVTTGVGQSLLGGATPAPYGKIVAGTPVPGFIGWNILSDTTTTTNNGPDLITSGNPNAPSWLQTNPAILGIANNTFIQEAANFVNALGNQVIGAYNFAVTGAGLQQTGVFLPTIKPLSTTIGASNIVTTRNITETMPMETISSDKNGNIILSGNPQTGTISSSTSTTAPLTLISQFDISHGMNITPNPNNTAGLSGKNGPIGVFGAFANIAGTYALSHPGEIIETAASFYLLGKAIGIGNEGLTTLTEGTRFESAADTLIATSQATAKVGPINVPIFWTGVWGGSTGLSATKNLSDLNPVDVGTSLAQTAAIQGPAFAIFMGLPYAKGIYSSGGIPESWRNNLDVSLIRRASPIGFATTETVGGEGTSLSIGYLKQPFSDIITGGRPIVSFLTYDPSIRAIDVLTSTPSLEDINSNIQLISDIPRITSANEATSAYKSAIAEPNQAYLHLTPDTELIADLIADRGVKVSSTMHFAGTPNVGYMPFLSETGLGGGTAEYGAGIIRLNATPQVTPEYLEAVNALQQIPTPQRSSIFSAARTLPEGLYPGLYGYSGIDIPGYIGISEMIVPEGSHLNVTNISYMTGPEGTKIPIIDVQFGEVGRISYLLDRLSYGIKTLPANISNPPTGILIGTTGLVSGVEDLPIKLGSLDTRPTDVPWSRADVILYNNIIRAALPTVESEFFDALHPALKAAYTTDYTPTQRALYGETPTIFLSQETVGKLVNFWSGYGEKLALGGSTGNAVWLDKTGPDVSKSDIDAWAYSKDIPNIYEGTAKIIAAEIPDILTHPGTIIPDPGAAFVHGKITNAAGNEIFGIHPFETFVDVATDPRVEVEGIGGGKVRVPSPNTALATKIAGAIGGIEYTPSTETEPARAELLINRAKDLPEIYGLPRGIALDISEQTPGKISAAIDLVNLSDSAKNLIESIRAESNNPASWAKSNPIQFDKMIERYDSIRGDILEGVNLVETTKTIARGRGFGLNEMAYSNIGLYTGATLERTVSLVSSFDYEDLPYEGAAIYNLGEYLPPPTRYTNNYAGLIGGYQGTTYYTATPKPQYTNPTPSLITYYTPSLITPSDIIPYVPPYTPPPYVPPYTPPPYVPPYTPPPYVPPYTPPPYVPPPFVTLTPSDVPPLWETKRRRRKPARFLELFSFEIGEDTPIPKRFGLGGEIGLIINPEARFIPGYRGVAQNIIRPQDRTKNRLFDIVKPMRLDRL